MTTPAIQNEEKKINSMKAWFLAARPKTLSAALVPILAAAGVAHNTAKEYSLVYVPYFFCVFALLSTIFLQIGTNLINDAMDFKKGADTHKRIGPMRVTQTGIFTAKQVLLAGSLSFLVAALLGIPLVLHGGFPILILGLVSILCGYLYTSGPRPLAYVGLGEVFVLLFFGFAAVCGLHYLLVGFVTLSCYVAALQVGLLSCVLIAINNFRDYQTDKQVGKNTLAARFGPTFARFEITFFLVVVFVCNLYWMKSHSLISGLLPFISLPLAIVVAKGLWENEPSPLFSQYLAKSSALQLIFWILLSLGLLMW